VQSSKPLPPKSESKLNEQKVKSKATPNDPPPAVSHTDEQREGLQMVPSPEELKAGNKKESENSKKDENSDSKSKTSKDDGNDRKKDAPKDDDKKDDKKDDENKDKNKDDKDDDKQDSKAQLKEKAN